MESLEPIEGIFERVELVGYSGLTEAEQNWHAVWRLEAEANNGSFEQFFRNVPGTWAFHALRGLEAVGARRMKAVLDSAIDLFPDREIPEDHTTRNAILDSFSEDRMAEMDRLASEFTDYPDPLAELLARYFAENAPGFPGPRTHLELWLSRRARGADTAPQFITRTIDIDKEAAIDRNYSSRPCPECGYPSPDYRPSCKRCGYPHGRA